MRKKIIICALSVLLLILSGVLAFYLHGQNRPIAGLSGDNRTLLRVWMLHSLSLIHISEPTRPY